LAERPFEEWLTSERERLHELAIQGLGHLLIHQQKAGAAEPAVQTGLGLLALDPLQEPVHRRDHAAVRAARPPGLRCASTSSA